MKKRRNRLVVFMSLFVCAQFCFAQDQPDRINLLSNQIENSKSAADLDHKLEELMALHLEESHFNEFYNFLERLEKEHIFKECPEVFYYKALIRFNQIKFLEENQMWQELFENKDKFNQDLHQSLLRAEQLIKETIDVLALKLNYLKWQIDKNNEDESIKLLDSLIDFTNRYVGTGQDDKVIKDMADDLVLEGQNIYAKRLYNIYVSKIAQSDISEQDLKGLAEGFLKDGKSDLAISLYAALLDRLLIGGKDKNIIKSELLSIADKFANSGWQEPIDPLFAEEIYKKIFSLYKKEELDALSQYRRAYNLERINKDESCIIEYLKLVNDYPDYTEKDRIYFRLGALTAYIFSKAEKAKEYFLKVVNDFPSSVDYLNSLYHLGLLEHWQGNLEKAKEFYAKILEMTKDLSKKPEVSNLTELRIKEIEQNKDIEYNLRMFLNAVLGKKETDKPYFQIDLTATEEKNNLNKNIKFQVVSYLTDTGCLQPAYTYLWSGNLGANQNPLDEFEFDTSYEEVGTKVVNVALVGEVDIIGGTIEIADVY